MSETESYYLLQDCLVALFYQLYFLQQQCGRGLGSGYGWTACRYGEGVNCTDCKSWICSASTNGKAHSIDSSSECGKKDKNKASPLQAFLCDCLAGFTCEKVEGRMKEHKSDISSKPNVYLSCYPEVKKHLEHSNDKPGSECPIPMGFRGCFKGAAALGAGGSGSAGSAVGGKGGSGAASSSNCVGLGIRGALKFYAHDDISESALYQLVRCICSLTRRVPRSTGTIYGFFYGLGGMCQKNYSGNGQAVSSALKGELLCCPGWRDPKCLMEALMGWTESDHSKNHTDGKPANPTLGSLYMCNNANSSASCGYYLQTLTGSMYKCVSDRFCETYVSWIVHLTWRLHEGLESLLDEFRNINCKDAGCSKKGGKGQCQCPTSGCTPSTHGDKCCCESVVHCVGVNALFYKFGFSYAYTSALANTKSNWVRMCSTFYQQLKNVIEQDPFKKLQTQLRAFIYTTRALFGVYIGVYWSIVLVYLLWSMTVNLDLMHIQSHWRSPSTHMVPVGTLLSNGSRNVKRVCTIGYFGDGTQGLLEKNDLYL